MCMASPKMATDYTLIYVCGGAGEGGRDQKSALCFDPRWGVWEALPDMYVRRHYPAAGVIAGNLYVCGGAGEEFGASIERFNMSAFKWEPRKGMHMPRFGHTATVMAGNLYAIGGAKEEGHGWNTAERYNPIKGKQGEWVLLPPMSESRYGHTSVAVRGIICVFGGWSLCSSSVLELRELIEVFDPKSTTWQTYPQHRCPRACIAAAVCGTSIYLCGGNDLSGVVNQVWRFDIDAGVMEELPPMHTPRAGHKVFVIGGALHVFGGASLAGNFLSQTEYPNEKRLSSSEKFDLITRMWEPSQPMPNRRVFFAAHSS